METFRWKRLGRVFHTEEAQNGTWRMEFAQSPTTLLFDTFVRVYFCCRPTPVNGQYMSYIAYIDLDKSNLLNVLRIAKEPVMKLGDLGTYDEFGTYPVSVVKSKDDLRVYYGGNTRCESVPFNAAIGVAKSDDNGESFARLGPGPVLSYSHDEPFVLGSPRAKIFNNQYYLWYAAGQKWVESEGKKQPVYKLRMATSSDGLDWKKHNRDLLPNILEENECQASADVTFENGKYHMFFSYRFNFGYKTEGRGYRMGYAWSTDLENWTRDDDRIGFTVSETGWDSESVSYAHLFKIDATTYMIYQGNQMGRSGIGLAKLEGTLK